MTNPELRRMETPLAERLRDALNDAENATIQFERSDPFSAYTVAEAGISLGRAVQKLIAILREEAPQPEED